MPAAPAPTIIVGFGRKRQAAESRRRQNGAGASQEDLREESWFRLVPRLHLMLRLCPNASTSRKNCR